MSKPVDLMRSLDAFSGVGDPGALEALYDSRPGAGPRAPQSGPAYGAAAGRATLLEAYRRHGFIRARLDPLGLATPPATPQTCTRPTQRVSPASPATARLTTVRQPRWAIPAVEQQR